MQLLKKFEVIQEVRGEPRQVVMAFLDRVFRDYKTKQAYTNPTFK
jgi:hypothetical protein